MRWITTTFVFLGLLLAIAGVARAGQEEQFTPEFKEAHTSYDAKHTPKLSAPDSVRRHGHRRRRRGAPVAVRAPHPVHRALQGHGRDRPRVSASRLLGAEGHLHDRARRRGPAARARGAYALGGVGGVEEDQRGALSSTVTRASSAPTLTSRLEVPSVSCQICSTYLPGGTLDSTNSPASLLSA